LKPHLRNIPINVFRKYLEWNGLKQIRTTGGHEIWSRKDLNRPIVFQNHKTPVPEFIVKRIMKTIGVDRDNFIDFLNNN